MASSAQTYPLKLTRAQRQVISQFAPAMVQRLKVGELDQRTISFTVEELKEIRANAHEAEQQARNGVVRNCLRHVADLANGALKNAQGIGAIPAAARIYQFKVSLIESRPLIWRRIQVKNCTLDKLHEHIQLAMGWTNSHLHHFRINARFFGHPELMRENFGDMDYADSTITKLSEIIPSSGKRYRFGYEYDFGDSWWHDILFEGCIRAEAGVRYPQCVAGARACPPEDVGGLRGYEEFLEALADVNHERHAEFSGWIGGSFNADGFDAAKATKRMRRGLPDWRH